jgi:hypothetical protein
MPSASSSVAATGCSGDPGGRDDDAARAEAGIQVPLGVVAEQRHVVGGPGHAPRHHDYFAVRLDEDGDRERRRRAEPSQRDAAGAEGRGRRVCIPRAVREFTAPDDGTLPSVRSAGQEVCPSMP